MLGRLCLLAFATATLSACDMGSMREVRVTGSSTVYPFARAVADAYVAADESRKQPRIESVGTVAGISSFCEGAGYEQADIVAASRRMRRSEYDKCASHNVGEVIEIPFGLDGIALAASNGGLDLRLSRRDLYLALAANPRGKPNTARTWKDVNPALPATPIKVLGPPPSSGTRDAFVELILEPGCLEAMEGARDLKQHSDPAVFDNACRRIRSDGAYVEEGEDDTRIVEALTQNREALGLFGYSYLEENRNRLHGVPIDGVTPSYDTIASGKYPGVRTLYLYVKNKHLKAVPGLRDYLDQFAAMWVPGGPLAKHGLIALPQKVRDRSAEAIQLALPLEIAALP